MGLATNLKGTASVLITKYGNSVVLSRETNDGVYNPQTGEFGTPATTTLNKKALKVDATSSVMSKSGLPENTWASIKAVYVMVGDDDVLALDNTWTIDGLPVVKVATTEAQDITVILNVYVG